jgi:ComF family protein
MKREYGTDENHEMGERSRSFRLFRSISSVSHSLCADLRDAAMATFYPTACRACGVTIESWRDGVACATCWSEVDQLRESEDVCAKCGLPLKKLSSRNRIGERRCGLCEDLAFNYARCCGSYRGALRESVLWLKDHPQISPRLRQLLIAAFSDTLEFRQTESIIPVPLHPSRLAERKFNQSEIIANDLSQATGLRVDTSSLIRSKKTERHRAGMGARERRCSLEEAFRVRAPRLIEGRVLLVVDDVMTTGSTAHEIAQTLLAAGARAVGVLTLARAANEFNL